MLPSRHQARIEQLVGTSLTSTMLPSRHEDASERLAGQLGWVGILVVCFLYKINPNPRKIICCGKKVAAQMPPFNLLLSWVGLA